MNTKMKVTITVKDDDGQDSVEVLMKLLRLCLSIKAYVEFDFPQVPSTTPHEEV